MASDTFIDIDGTNLDTHDAKWKAAAYLASDIEVFNNAARIKSSRVWYGTPVYFENGQPADQESQVKLVGNAVITSPSSAVSVRINLGNRGYEMYMTYSAGNYIDTRVNKNGSWLATLATHSLPVSSDYVLKIKATGVGPVIIEGFRGGVSLGSVQDNISPITSGYPGFMVGGAGQQIATIIDDWTDNVAAGGGAIDLVISEAHHFYLADSPTLTQTHLLAAADSAHAHTSDSQALTQIHLLAVQDSVHGHSAEASVLTQTHILSVADSTHGHSAESPEINVILTLVVTDSLHSHAADSPALTQTHLLTVQDSAHSHSVDPILLAQIHNLLVAECLHAHLADSPLTSVGGLGVVVDPSIVNITARRTLENLVPERTVENLTPRRTLHSL
jgi:hypothetical protein